MIDFGEHMPRKKSLDLTPMIDVVFLLLIFFMLTSIFGRPMLPLNLPDSETGEVTAESPVTISILHDRSLHLNNEPITMEVLLTTLSTLIKASKDREVSLRADRGVPFGDVVKVMDLAKMGGAEEISVVTEAR
jgi:biopolymer transport protein ExbD